MTTINKYFAKKEQTATGSWAAVDMGFVAKNVRFILKSGAGPLYIKFENMDTDVEDVLLDSDNKREEFLNYGCKKVFIKGTGDVRIYSWSNN